MSKESYIRGFCKAAEAHGINPDSILKVAQWISDGYFKYDPNSISDIYYDLNPELEQSMTDFARRSNPEPKPAMKWTIRNGNTPQPKSPAPITKPRQPAAILKDLGLTPDKVRAMNQAKPTVSSVSSSRGAMQTMQRIGRVVKALKRIR